MKNIFSVILEKLLHASKLMIYLATDKEKIFYVKGTGLYSDPVKSYNLLSVWNTFEV